ncbi:putative mitochondrial outer membrane protein (Sam35) [Metarhizium anisopliae]|nr:putative mitochondrial outer membrane protein (Sam35) [Metarhizium anisopliae]
MAAATAAPSAPSESSSIFAVPRPIRSLFKLFPLRTYEPEPLPARAPDRTRPRAKLYVFSSDEDALRGRPSFNPTCLKWQTYLRMANIQVDLVPSTNHASPSGALPFLLPPTTDSRPDIPLTGTNISQHTPLLARLYLPPSPLVSTPLLHTLRSAATNEILKTTRRPLLLPEQLYSDARIAFQTLDSVLGFDEWFFGAPEPALFDAEVFAYTHLILDASFGWQDDALGACLEGCDRLVEHRRRLYEWCWH